MQLDVRLDASLADVAVTVRGLEEAGIAGVFTYEGPNDPFLPLGAAAVASTSLQLYTNLAIALPRSPMHLAYLAQDLSRASDGRFSLGLGSQVKRHVTDRFGAVWESPVEQMREVVLAVRAIQQSWTTGEPLAFEGRWTRHTYMPPLFVPAPAPPVPLLLGAVGPKMTAMAVEVADGLLMHPFNNGAPDVPDGFPVIGAAIVGVGVSDEELATAREAVRGLIAFYASTPAYRPVLDAHGWGDLQPRLRDLTRAGDWAGLPAAVPDEVVETIGVVGRPAAVAEALRCRYASCTRIALSTPYAVSLEALSELTALAR